MLTVTTKIVNNKPVMDALHGLQKRMGDLTPAMRDVGQAIETQVSGRFETRTDPLGHPWAPRAESTMKSYPKNGFNKILERHGHMLKSLTASADSTSVSVGMTAVSDSKNKDVYAFFHENSTDKMPRRGMFFADPNAGTLAPADETAVLDIIGTFLMDGL